MDVAVQENRASLLDILLVLAENLKLLVLGPLLVGVMALGVGYILPPSYVSQAILLIPLPIAPTAPTAPTAAQAAAMMVSPLVLDPVIAANPAFKDKPIEKARLELSNRVKAKVGKDGLLRLDVAAVDPKEAQQLANAVIDSWLKSTVPVGYERSDLETKLSYAQKSLALVSGLLERLTVDGAVSLSKPLTRGEAGTGLVALGELQARYLNEVLTIPRALQGLSRDVVKQSPTLATEADSPKKGLMAVLATLGAGFSLFLFVFMRQAWRRVAQRAGSVDKLNRLYTVWK